jgi:glucose-1-phosphate thymidylyltransferase
MRFVKNKATPGIAQAFLIGAKFIGSPVCLILGDNIFYGNSTSSVSLPDGRRVQLDTGCMTRALGVVEFDAVAACSVSKKSPWPRSPAVVHLDPMTARL